jgi:hypothetical protein
MLKLVSLAAIGIVMATGPALAMPRPTVDLSATARPDNVRCHGRHCRVHVYGYRRAYGYRPGYRTRWHSEDPADMRVGSRRWWNAKDREGSTGRP